VPGLTRFALAGHMSGAMLERYSHIVRKANREDAAAISLRVHATFSGGPPISPTREDGAQVRHLVRY